MTYTEALDRVKVGEFIKQGYQVRGVVHVGANDGYEVQWYQQLNLKIICVEPQHEPAQRFIAKYGNDVILLQDALGNIDGTGTMHILSSDGGSSLLPAANETARDYQKVIIRRWASVIDHLPNHVIESDYNACVIDVQGMELDVLRGMDDHIKNFDYFVVEVSASPVYRGEAYAEEVCRYLEMMGFLAITPIPRHDDMLFVKQSILEAAGKTPALEPFVPALPKSTYLNVGCGTRQFPGWCNIDINPACNPDIVADWRSLRLPNAFADMIVAHQTFEHAGCGEQPIQEAWRVLKIGGSLIVSVPDLRKLAKLWFAGEISTQIYMTNIYGPYAGDEADRHKWGWDREALVEQLNREARWRDVKDFDYRPIPGADIARDDRWILCMEAVK